MMALTLHCPFCHHATGNVVTVDWPEPLDVRRYHPLICQECGSDFTFEVDRSGMRSIATREQRLLSAFLEGRRNRPKKARNA